MTAPRPAPAGRLLETAIAARARRGTGRIARIAVLGEFNSGKTTLVNAMLGADVFPAGIATRTELPAIAQFASRASLSMKLADGRRIPLAVEDVGRSPPAGARQLCYQLPLESLRCVRVIDMPAWGVEDGAAASKCMVEACRGVDLVVWCTPAMQAWKHSEQHLWLSLPAALRKRGILAVTFADQVASQSDLDRLLARLRADAGRYFTDIVILGGMPPHVEEATHPFRRKLHEKTPQT